MVDSNFDSVGADSEAPTEVKLELIEIFFLDQPRLVLQKQKTEVLSVTFPRSLARDEDSLKEGRDREVFLFFGCCLWLCFLKYIDFFFHSV